MSDNSFTDLIYVDGNLYLPSGTMIYKYDIKNDGMRILYKDLSNLRYLTFDKNSGYDNNLNMHILFLISLNGSVTKE